MGGVVRRRGASFGIETERRAERDARIGEVLEDRRSPRRWGRVGTSDAPSARTRRRIRARCDGGSRDARRSSARRARTPSISTRSKFACDGDAIACDSTDGGVSARAGAGARRDARGRRSSRGRDANEPPEGRNDARGGSREGGREGGRRRARGGRIGTATRLVDLDRALVPLADAPFERARRVRAGRGLHEQREEEEPEEGRRSVEARHDETEEGSTACVRRRGRAV
eukprot:7048-Pelagococcus_subviridis.AAC.2